MNTKENLYFIALIPQREVRYEVTNFKIDLSKRFDTKKALKVYTHITLKIPFKHPADSHYNVVNWFYNLKIDHSAFTIELKNFGAFYNKYNPVIYVNPIVTPDLSAIQNKIITSFKSFLPNDVHPVDLKFKPHVTIAYRDLTSENFLKAWEEYKSKTYTAKFDVNGFYLLQHNTKKWNVIATYNLN